jgi:hypothetical protein
MLVRGGFARFFVRAAAFFFAMGYLRHFRTRLLPHCFWQFEYLCRAGHLRTHLSILSRKFHAEQING